MGDDVRGGQPGGLTRRTVLRDGSVAAVAVLVAGSLGGGGVAVAVTPGEPAFLTGDELHTLRGLVDVFIPADQDPGAVAGGCAEAIDALLGAFETSPPRIYAGAPFSDRGGSPVNHFEDFTPLDRYERRAWRLRIEGSRGRRALEFNGPVKGWQTIYREGLAALEAAAGDRRFADLPAPARDFIVRTSEDPAIAELVDVAFPHTYELMYGAPEYGGNRDLAGWDYTNWDGDVLPRGYTREQVEELDADAPGRRLGEGDAALLAELSALAPLAGSSELAHNLLVRSGGTLSGLQRELAGLPRARGGSRGG